MTIHNYRVPINRFKFTKHIQLMMLSHVSEIGICPYCFNYTTNLSLGICPYVDSPYCFNYTTGTSIAQIVNSRVLIFAAAASEPEASEQGSRS
jgi:hypothetical protein